MQHERPILVTGASGKLGEVLRRSWAMQPEMVLNPLWQTRKNARPGWLRWDMLTAPYVGPSLTGGCVLHLAGGATPATCSGNDNADLAISALNMARDGGLSHVFVASSAAVYGKAGPDPLDEDQRPIPASVYGFAKARMEQSVMDWHSAHPGGPQITILRIGNVFGSDSLIGDAATRTETVLDPVPGTAGGPVRSYIGPQSLARVIAQLCSLAFDRASLPLFLNVSAAPAVAMASLLEAARLPWRFGSPNDAVIPRVELQVRRLYGLVKMPPDAGSAETMAAEWRQVQGGSA